MKTLEEIQAILIKAEEEDLDFTDDYYSFIMCGKSQFGLDAKQVFDGEDPSGLNRNDFISVIDIEGLQVGATYYYSSWDAPEPPCINELFEVEPYEMTETYYRKKV